MIAGAGQWEAAGFDNEPLESQVARLAAYILAEVPGEPSESQGAIDTIIRLHHELTALHGAQAAIIAFIKRRLTQQSQILEMQAGVIGRMGAVRVLTDPVMDRVGGSSVPS